MRSRCTKRKSFSALSHAKIAGWGPVYRDPRSIFITYFNDLIENSERHCWYQGFRYRFRERSIVKKTAPHRADFAASVIDQYPRCQQSVPSPDAQPQRLS
jgi:hypothetical protein